MISGPKDCWTCEERGRTWIKRDEDGSVAKQKFQSERINAREGVRRCLLDLRGMRLMMKNWTTEGGDPIYTIRWGAVWKISRVCQEGFLQKSTVEDGTSREYVCVRVLCLRVLCVLAQTPNRNEETRPRFVRLCNVLDKKNPRQMLCFVVMLGRCVYALLRRFLFFPTVWCSGCPTELPSYRWSPHNEKNAFFSHNFTFYTLCTHECKLHLVWSVAQILQGTCPLGEGITFHWTMAYEFWQIILGGLQVSGAVRNGTCLIGQVEDWESSRRTCWLRVALSMDRYVCRWMESVHTHARQQPTLLGVCYVWVSRIENPWCLFVEEIEIVSSVLTQTQDKETLLKTHGLEYNGRFSKEQDQSSRREWKKKIEMLLSCNKSIKSIQPII